MIVLTEDFKVAPQGHTVEHYSKGDEVTGVVADMALQAGKAKKRTPKPSRTKPVTPSHEG